MPDQDARKRRGRRAKEPPEVGLGLLLREANNAFNRLLRDRLSVHDVTFAQFQHLRQLWNEDGLNQVELARRIGIEKASSTSVLDQLEQRGFISRTRDATDRRKLNIRLTADGAALENDLWARAAEANAIARQGFTRAEMIALFDLVGRIIENIHAAPAKGEDDPSR